MRAEKKGELFTTVIAFFICLGFTIYTTWNIMEVWRIQQEIAEQQGVPFVYDPFSYMYIVLSMIPTLYLLGRIIKILNEVNKP